MSQQSYQQKNYPILDDLSESVLDENNSIKKQLNFIESNKTIVDFGCATGYMARLMSQRECVVTGVEINEKAAEVARQYCKNVVVADLDIASVLDIFQEQTFDIAVFGDVLEHLRNPWKVLIETKKILSDNGYVVASIPNIAHGAIRLALMEGKFQYQELGILDNTHLRFFTRKTVQELFENAGYLIEKIDTTKVPLFSDSNLVPTINRDILEAKNINIECFENEEDIDTLQFIIKAFPTSIEKQYFLSQKERNELIVKLEESQSQLHLTRSELQESQSQLDLTRSELQESQSQLDLTRSELQESQSQLDLTRSELQESQSQLHLTRSELEESQSQLHLTRSELEQSQSQLHLTRSELEQSQSQLHLTRSELEQSQSQLEYFKTWIAAMESSKFWKLRTKWFQLKKRLKIETKETVYPLALYQPNIQVLIDLAVLIPNVGLYLEGWIYDDENQIKQLMLKTEHDCIDIKPILVKKDRHDLATHFQDRGYKCNTKDIGFLSLCNLVNISAITNIDIVVDIGMESTINYKIEYIKDCYNPLSIIQHILTNTPFPDYRMRPTLDNHVGPAIRSLWKNRKNLETKKVVKEYGTQVKNPKASIIVPLYGRIDFLKYQLALFADDPDFKESELIYVLDDPRLYDEFLGLCDTQSNIFKIPFKTLYLGTNLGYAGANNAGVSIANGDWLILLNSDVMPTRSKWITSLIDTYNKLVESGVQVGAIGPKLLYGDGSIQHIGMYFSKYSPWEELWINDQPRKGQPVFSDTSTQPQKVPALTGACLMIKRELYHRLHGFDEEYILGDFEDSDLCLKVVSEKFENYYIPEVELYHLERQSFYHKNISQQSWQQNLTLYNCWVFNNKWSKFLNQKFSS
jgi:GT2 family glycosyltransferase/2-polyprenyl-3-methyl-5-hydroxy-6-metoxy-1,4-benzoquinol methylase